MTTGTTLRGAAAAGLILLACLSFPPAASADGGTANDAPASPRRVPADWLSEVRQNVQDAEYRVTWRVTDDRETGRTGWQAPNRAQGFRTWFTGDGIRLVPRAEEEASWEWGLELIGYGRGSRVVAVDPGDPEPEEKRVRYRRGDVVEWYVNDADGLEQGFTLSAAPDRSIARSAGRPSPVPGARRRSGDGQGRSGAAFVILRLNGTLAPRISTDGQAIDFAGDSGIAELRYGKLRVSDATGRVLDAWMEGFAEGGIRGIRIVFDDAQAVYPVTVDPMVTTAAWMVEGGQEEAELGASVASAGDVNSDGFDDVIVGAYRYDVGGADTGRAYLYLGSASGLSATPAWTATGSEPGAWFGHDVAWAGDVNSDGFDDVIVGAPAGFSYTNDGHAYVYHGEDSAVGLGASPAWSAAGEHPGDPGTAGSAFGFAVATAGDVNSDGCSDVIIGSPYYNDAYDNAGRAYVYLGCAPTGLATTPYWTTEGASTGLLGASVSSAGDVNGDQIDDVIVGTSPGGLGGAEQAVYYGSATAISTTPDWSYYSHAWFVTSCDVNADGLGDVILGDSGVSVFHGAPGGLPDSADRTLVSTQTGSGFGASVSCAGDVNSDGFDDVVVGAPDYASLTNQVGRAYLYLGSPSGLPPGADSWTWSVAGTRYQSEYGYSVSGAGDVNGDGYDDIIVGARGHWIDNPGEGAAFVYHGAPTPSVYDAARGLGFDASGIEWAEWGVRTRSPDPPPTGSWVYLDDFVAPHAVAPGPIPGSVLLSTGRASDGGLGDTDWGNDGGVDVATFRISLWVPEGARTLRFTTQLISSEYENGSPGRDSVRGVFTRDDEGEENGLDLSAITEMQQGPIGSPFSHAINVDGVGKIRLTLELWDGPHDGDWSSSGGSEDSALILSRVFFSDLPLPPEETGLYYSNPAPADVSLTAGSYTFARNLMSMPGIAMPFRLAVRYNSGSVRTGDVGRKWTHSYESYAQKLYSDPDSDGVPPFEVTGVLVRHGNGAAEYFEPDGPGRWQPRYSGIYSSLTESGDCFVYQTKSHMTYRFDVGADALPSRCLLGSVTDPSGNSFTLQYDADKKLDSVVDTRGETIDFTFDGERLVSAEYDSSSVSLQYDPATDDLVAITDLEGRTTHFAYDDFGYLLTATDPDGVIYVSNTFEQYQGLNYRQVGERVVTQRNGGDADPYDSEAGHAIDYGADWMTRTDRLGASEHRQYDVKDHPARRIDPSGVLWEYDYDEYGNTIETRRTVPSETATEIVETSSYDDSGNLLSRVQFPERCFGGTSSGAACASDTDCSGGTCGARTTFEYDAFGDPISQIDALGSTMSFFYDAEHKPVTETDPLGYTVTHAYDAQGLPISTTDALGNVSTCAYDSHGNLVTVTDPLGHVTTYEYDGLGRKTSATDPRGNKICFEYDAAGHMVARIELCGYCVIASVPGEPCASDDDCATGTCGLRTGMTYDTWGRLTSRTDPGGAVTTYTYTPTGKQHQATNPLEGTVSHGYDAEDRMVSEVEPLPSERLGLDAGSLITTLVYDEAGRLRTVTDALGTLNCDPVEPSLCGTVLASYDELGNRTAITDPRANTVRFEYDSLGRVVRETDALGQSVESVYDARGSLRSRKNARGQAVNYEYDDAGRLVEVRLPDTSIAHVLDANGNATVSLSSHYGNVIRTFDGLDRLSSRTDEFGQTVLYGYDPAGNLSSLGYPDGSRVSYSYDALNRMVRVEDWYDPASPPPSPLNMGDCEASASCRLTKYAYDAVGNLVRADLPDGSVVSYSYDLANRLTGISDGPDGGAALFHAAFTLNSAGRRIGADLTLPLEPILDSSDGVLVYDTLNQLVSRGAESFDYDADGNLIAGRIGGSDLTMSYDDLNLLADVHDGSSTTTFGYDTDGLRVDKTTDGVTERYVMDPLAVYSRVLMTQDDGGATLARYVYGLGLISRQDGAGDLSVYHFDSRGSTVALTNAMGVVTDRYAYDPHGLIAARGEENLTPNPFTYVGREGVFDDGNGLFFMRHRYYAADLMRFIQKDTADQGILLASQSLNRYAYVQGDPIMQVDPNGECAPCVGAVIGVSAVFVADLIDDGQINSGWEAYAAGAVIGAIGPTIAAGEVIGLGAGVAWYGGGQVVEMIRGERDPFDFEWDPDMFSLTITGSLTLAAEKRENDMRGHWFYERDDVWEGIRPTASDVWNEATGPPADSWEPRRGCGCACEVPR